MTAKHSANAVAARARKRIQSPPQDYFDAPDYSKPVRKLVYTDLLSGASHEFVLYIHPQRIDQFRVILNGKVWRERIGWTHILAGLRKAAGRFGRFNP